MSGLIWIHLFDTLMVLKKSSTQRVKYGKQCEEKVKAIFENPKADQNTLLCKYVIFQILFLKGKTKSNLEVLGLWQRSLRLHDVIDAFFLFLNQNICCGYSTYPRWRYLGKWCVSLHATKKNCSFDLILYILVNVFHLCFDGFSRVET